MGAHVPESLVQPEASSHSLRRTLSSELASDKLYQNQIVASTPYPREIPRELAANGAGFPAGRTSVGPPFIVKAYAMPLFQDEGPLWRVFDERPLSEPVPPLRSSNAISGIDPDRYSASCNILHRPLARNQSRLEKSSCVGEAGEVPPLSWTPKHLCFRSPQCRRNAPYIRLSSGDR